MLMQIIFAVIITVLAVLITIAAAAVAAGRGRETINCGNMYETL
jgi:hypothetical protein